ncbi:restriction endonuclease [Winogradskyella sp.]|uniref:restriction endonuclease n=1 Tax=Winogradskyella sp. TaxID=1883156 RepID=UPI002634987F|nr:restriction endonuclease [Winogradskyella sp.]
MYLDFNEIKDGRQFEELTALHLEEKFNNHIKDIEIRKSGVGADGGRDILVDFKVTDGIQSFNRKWIVQCKFRNINISTNVINDVNIPSLIHSYGASGYLIICRKRPTSKLSNFIEQLNLNCKFGYKYQIWSGEQFKRSLLTSTNHTFMQFFPNYYKYLTREDK